jgi:hypothetical protein
LHLESHLRAERIYRAMLFQNQRTVDCWQIAGGQIVVTRQDMGIMPEQEPEFARIISILE